MISLERYVRGPLNLTGNNGGTFTRLPISVPPNINGTEKAGAILRYRISSKVGQGGYASFQGYISLRYDTVNGRSATPPITGQGDGRTGTDPDFYDNMGFDTLWDTDDNFYLTMSPASSLPEDSQNMCVFEVVKFIQP